MEKITDYFGSLVFNDDVMKEKLSPEVYASLKKTVGEGQKLDTSVASAVADAMKDWATEHGATHFTHWFQPLTGITAEKHDSFLSEDKNGRAILDFSVKELIKGEPDASSFPSGGLRATFEARGYTAWDPTSYAFIKGKTLCIPTAFCSYGGEALDKKTPLLRSMEAISTQALRIVRLFGNTEARHVDVCVGAEQEYFLIDKKMCEKRKDLIFTGRTLFGARPPKGQELDDHYFGSIKPRVAEFMEDLDKELWRVGIFAKTEHNEAAPAQHELAPIYTTTNTATDHNQLTMELMQKVAARHGLVCLLHEKPFNGVNGSGKHNNWSLCTDNGVNLLKPGDTPYENAQFLLFLCAVIRAVDEYADLLRISAATAGNDHRLGANEAPPAIISMFLGSELTSVLEAVENDAPYNKTERMEMLFGVSSLPKFKRDTTDRNRTSPFAFTGNKFEFRMLGAPSSIADTNVMLNAAVADVLSDFADRLQSAADFDTELHGLLKETIRKHKRILFNGNGYDKSWIDEAESRGLPNRRTTPDSLPHLLDEKNAAMLKRRGVFNDAELKARCDILLENYTKTVAIEAATMIDMSRRQIMPAVSKYAAELCDRAEKNVQNEYEVKTSKRLSELLRVMYESTSELETVSADIKGITDVTEHSYAIRDRLIPIMERLRSAADEAETLTAEDFWPFPTYEKLLFSVY